MKVAILTQPLGHNIGGLLQAFALQRYLRSIGVHAETIDRRPDETMLGLLKRNGRKWERYLKEIIKRPPSSRSSDLRLQDLIGFRDCYINTSKPIRTNSRLRRYFQQHPVDAVIVGSDQVWRPKYSPNIMNFYLDFLQDIGYDPRRVAYGASFGVSNWEYDGNTSQRCKELLARFDSVSVREISATYLCESEFGVDASLVPDPTLLLEPSDYDALCSNTHTSSTEGYVFEYFLDPCSGKKALTNMAVSVLKLGFVEVSPAVSQPSNARNEAQNVRLPSVEMFIMNLRNSSFVITDSFHGVVFSILFNRPFLVLANEERGSARISSLLSIFGLESRMHTLGSRHERPWFGESIDWDPINEMRAAFAEKGRAFLRKALLFNRSGSSE